MNIAIADDHPLLAQGIAEALSSSEDVSILWKAHTLSELQDKIAKEIPDVLILDISFPDGSGLEMCKTLIKATSNLRIIILSSYDSPSYIKAAMRNGALGYLTKTSSLGEIQAAVLKVMKGEHYFSSDLQQRVFAMFSQEGRPTQEEVISPREKEVLVLIADELTNAEIAENLSISVRTVDNHRNNLIQKLGVRNTAGLIKKAMNLGYI